MTAAGESRHFQPSEGKVHRVGRIELTGFFYTRLSIVNTTCNVCKALTA
jgi:hypothetical protein